MASTELDIEPGNQCVDEVRSSDIEGEWCPKSQIFAFHGIQVNSKDLTGVGNAGFKLYSVDKRFGQSGNLQRCKIESINIVPDYAGSVMSRSSLKRRLTPDFLILIIPVFNTSHVYCGFVREYQPSGFEVMVSGVKNCIEHAFVE